MPDSGNEGGIVSVAVLVEIRQLLVVVASAVMYLVHTYKDNDKSSNKLIMVGFQKEFSNK